MTYIKNVAVKEDHKLEVLLENGHSVTLNMKSRLETARFGLLADRNFFERVTTDGSFLRWGDRIEISVNEVFQLAKK